MCIHMHLSCHQPASRFTRDDRHWLPLGPRIRGRNPSQLIQVPSSKASLHDSLHSGPRARGRGTIVSASHLAWD